MKTLFLIAALVTQFSSHANSGSLYLKTTIVENLPMGIVFMTAEYDVDAKDIMVLKQDPQTGKLCNFYGIKIDENLFQHDLEPQCKISVVLKENSLDIIQPTNSDCSSVCKTSSGFEGEGLVFDSIIEY
jgi:hypothetical protein